MGGATAARRARGAARQHRRGGHRERAAHARELTGGDGLRALGSGGYPSTKQAIADDSIRIVEGWTFAARGPTMQGTGERPPPHRKGIVP